MYGSTNKIVQIMTLGDSHDSFYAKVKIGHLGFCMGKTFLFFGNYYSPKSQMLLEHSTKCVNVVE